MFEYPAKTVFGKPVPKTKIYAHAKTSRRVRDLFVAQIAAIVWKHKLAPETTNLPAKHGVMEIEIFEISQKTPELDERILQAIDKAIPFPIFYELTHDGKIRHVAAYKRPSEADANKWVVNSYFGTNWMSPKTATRQRLPVVLDLKTLYDRMLRHYIDIPARPDEPIADHVSRANSVRAKRREAERLEVRLRNQKQFNRKVTLNQELRGINAEIDLLTEV